MPQYVGGAEPPTSTNVITVTQSAQWSQLKGKSQINVSAKGIQNGLSSINNDGADFGPDTTLGATTTGQWGAPYTETYGWQEGANYIGATGQSGTMLVFSGNYSWSSVVTISESITIMSNYYHDAVAVSGGEQSPVPPAVLITYIGTAQNDLAYITATNPDYTIQGVRIIGLNFDARPANNSIMYGIHLQDVVLAEVAYCALAAGLGSADPLVFIDGAGISTYLQGKGGGNFYIHHNISEFSSLFYIDNNITIANIWIEDNWLVFTGNGTILINAKGCCIKISGNKFENIPSGHNTSVRIGTLAGQVYPTHCVEIISYTATGQVPAVLAVDNLVYTGQTPQPFWYNVSGKTNGLIAKNNIGWNPVGFNATNITILASDTYYTNPNPHDCEVYITDVGSGVTAYSIEDAWGNTETFTTSISVGKLCVLGPNESISFTYTTTAPTLALKGE